MKKITFSLLVLLCVVGNVCAQVEPLWKVSLDSKAKWITLTSTGTVVVATNSALIGIDPEKQQKSWEIKAIDQIEKESFTEIEGTSFAMYESTNPLKSLKTQTTIIDFTTGRTIYNNVDADLTIREKFPLLEIGAILLEAKAGKKIFLTLVDIASGNERWRLDLPERKTGFGLGSLKQAIKSLLDASPITDLDGNILYPDDKVLKRIDAQTGKVLWSNENEKTIGRLNLSDDGLTVYLGSGRKIMGITVADGKDQWKDPLSISGDFRMFIPSRDKKLYVITSREINLIDTQTGKAAWKKPAEFDLPFASLRFTNEGILIFGTTEKESMFDYINFEGKGIWKRSYKTDRPIVSFQLTAKGILFANIEEANMIDLKTGDDTLWKKRIKLKGNPVTFIDEKMALIYADEKLYRVNIEGNNYELLAENIKFEGKDEDVRRIEVLDNGYLLSSQQNLWLIGTNGKVVYSKYYKPASVGTALKVLGVLGQVYATYDNLETVQDPSAPNTIIIQRSKKGDQIVGDISKAIANRKKSFSASDANFIMTRVEDGDNKRVGMVKVDKRTGEEKGKIVLKTLDPIYEVDYATGQLFTLLNGAVSGSEFFCYKL
ncbi:MAG: PQQ-binding-like beta-propeller repeat protein [Cyclobacteriaceae bacterium]